MSADCCPVCLESLAVGSLGLSCGHAIHASCLLATFQGDQRATSSNCAGPRQQWGRAAAADDWPPPAVLPTFKGAFESRPSPDCRPLLCR